MTIQDNIDLQRSVEPQILNMLLGGSLSIQDLCARIDAPEYIIKRAFWSLVSREQAYLTDDYDAALVE